MTAAGAVAENYDTMYLVKGQRVVGKYKIDDVDYATFSLPDDVDDANLSLSIDAVCKNTVTYTVNTVTPTTAYAHNILSAYELDYMALDMEGENFANLDAEAQKSVMQYTLAFNAYTGIGTHSWTQVDYQEDGTGYHFNVLPGTTYYLCAWELDADYEPLETFVYKEFTTDAPGQSAASSEFTYTGLNEQGAGFNVTASDDAYYIRTCWGLKSSMELYEQLYGLDYLMGMFGQSWSPDELQGEWYEGVSNATWPAPESGDYVLFTRTYDASGDCSDAKYNVSIEIEGQGGTGPAVTIFSKEKREGYVSVNFEISPSNVEEAYVRLMGENDCDDRLNMGYELYELACGGDAEDITSDINSMGEYTFTSSSLSEQWYALLIYALDKDGNRSTTRINFFPDTLSDWSIYDPVYSAPARARKLPKAITGKRNPTLKRAH